MYHTLEHLCSKIYFKSKLWVQVVISKFKGSLFQGKVSVPFIFATLTGNTVIFADLGSPRI